MQNDEIVSSWRNGAESVDGLDNPAGPLFTAGTAATEAAMTAPHETNFFLTFTAITCNSPAHTCFCN
jgi:hypothetical protein